MILNEETSYKATGLSAPCIPCRAAESRYWGGVLSKERPDHRKDPGSKPHSWERQLMGWPLGQMVKSWTECSCLPLPNSNGTSWYDGIRRRNSETMRSGGWTSSMEFMASPEDTRVLSSPFGTIWGYKKYLDIRNLENTDHAGSLISNSKFLALQGNFWLILIVAEFHFSVWDKVQPSPNQFWTYIAKGSLQLLILLMIQTPVSTSRVLMLQVCDTTYDLNFWCKTWSSSKQPLPSSDELCMLALVRHDWVHGLTSPHRGSPELPVAPPSHLYAILS